jgi:hypothetical protein
MEEGEEVTIAEDQRVVDISLKDLAKTLEEFAKARDWEKYHSPRNLLLAMVMSYPPCICVQSIHAKILYVCVFRVRSHRPHIAQNVFFFFAMYWNAPVYDSVLS